MNVIGVEMLETRYIETVCEIVFYHFRCYYFFWGGGVAKTGLVSRLGVHHESPISTVEGLLNHNKIRFAS